MRSKRMQSVGTGWACQWRILLNHLRIAYLSD